MLTLLKRGTLSLFFLGFFFVAHLRASSGQAANRSRGKCDHTESIGLGPNAMYLCLFAVFEIFRFVQNSETSRNLGLIVVGLTEQGHEMVPSNLGNIRLAHVSSGERSTLRSPSILCGLFSWCGAKTD